MGRGGSRPGTGRPKGRNPNYDTRLNIRVEKDQMVRWAKGADLAGASGRADWVRKTLDREYRRLVSLYEDNDLM